MPTESAHRPHQSAPTAPRTPAEWLAYGQQLEAAGALEAAIAAIDRGITSAIIDRDPEGRRRFAVAWMNRGNVLQRLPVPDAAQQAVEAYDVAISVLETLDVASDPALRNTLGAAWMNRGRALQLGRDRDRLLAAIASHEQAISWLASLPRTESPAYGRNLAGAWLNLADARLGLATAEADALALTAARAAVALTPCDAHTSLELADLGLKTRRALVEAIGRLLVRCSEGAGQRELADEAADAIDAGLALARGWEQRGVKALRSLALRLFRAGAQLQRIHQPHFLAEFLLENAGPASVFAEAPEFVDTARDAIAALRRDLALPRILDAADPASLRWLEIARSVRDLDEVFASGASNDHAA